MSYSFNPTPLYRLIEKTEFLCSDNDVSEEADMMSCFNPTEFYRLIVTKQWTCDVNNDKIPDQLKKTYYFNPTDLYKMIEKKYWNKVKEIILDYPEEAAIWVTRRKKDGRLRWKMLPLHAALCLKAPTDVILQMLQSFPEAAKCTDDQGMLPIHLALTNDDIDEQIIKNLIKENPNGVKSIDNEGRTPLALKGEAIIFCFDAALALEKVNISKEEADAYELRLSSEKEFHTKKIKEIEEESNALFRDLTGIEIEFQEKLDVIFMQQDKILEMKLSEIDLGSQNNMSAHGLEIHQDNSREDAEEIAWLHALVAQQGNTITELNHKVKSRSKKISEMKTSKKLMKISLKGEKKISDSLQIQVDDLNRNVSKFQKTLDLQSKIANHVDTMKKQQDVCNLLNGQIGRLEAKLAREADAVSENASVALPPNEAERNWTRNFSTLFNNITNVI